MPGTERPSEPAALERLLAGRYRLLTTIARGGMAEVWEGHDEVLSRPVAVKVLMPHLAADGTFLERFRREAVTAARLAHPGIVATFDTGLDDGTAFIVMELVRGANLRQWLNAYGRLEWAVSVSIARQVADALAYAHQAGLVHRDVKPANVLLLEDERGGLRVKVTDFGIAKAAYGLDSDLTRTGMVLGTPKYLSPEQIKGRDPDARADLYSLGVVFYEMLVGEPPYVGETDMATALAHLNDRVPKPSASVRGIPGPLDRIVVDLLAKNPDRRVASALELRDRLDALSSFREGGGRRARRRAETPTGRPAGVAAWGGAPPTGSSPFGTAPTGTWGAAPATGTGGGVTPTGTGGGVTPTGAWSTGTPTGTWGRPVDDGGPPTVASPAGFGSVPGGPGGPGGPYGPAGNGSGPAGPDPGMAPTTALGTPGGWGQHPTSALRGRPDPPTTELSGVPSPRRNHRTERRVGLVVLGLVLVGALVAGGLLATSRSGKGSGTHGGTAQASGPTDPIESVEVYLSVGGHTVDNPGMTRFAFDGNAATYWQTDIYSSPRFGNLYPGEGLEIRLASPAKVHSLTVSSPTTGWAASTYVSSAPVTTGQPLSAWGAATDSRSGVGGDATFDLGGKQGSYVLLWITDLGSANTAKIAELSVR